MAVALAQECPHCAIGNTGFSLVGAGQDPLRMHVWNMLFCCNVCGGPIAAKGDGSAHGRSPQESSGNAREAFANLETWPKPRTPSIPAHLPEAVARAFLQAEESVASEQRTEATAAMDRRALELATRLIAPEHAGLSLFHRIERLALDHLITPALRDWAHGLRVIGNDALHEPDGISHDEARQTHELTRFVLLYLFTLPKQVELGRAAQPG